MYTTEDINLLTALGRVPARTSIRRFARNPLVGTGAFEDIWFAGGLYTGWLTAASTVRVKAGGNAADTAAGLGARSVTISGLDENWNEASETVVTAGASASAATTTTFLRVNEIKVATAGAYTAANTGNITVESVTSPVDLALVEAGVGVSQLSMYTVPDGCQAVLSFFQCSVGGNADTVEPRFRYRTNADTTTAPFSPALTALVINARASTIIQLDSYSVFAARTDLWVDCINRSSGDISVNVGYNMKLISG